MAVIAAKSLSREPRIKTSSLSSPAWTPLSGLDDADRVSIDEGDDVLDDLRVGAVIVLLGDIADMRGQDYVRRRAQRMVDRQRLFVVDIEPGIGEASLLQRRDNCPRVADRPARGVDEDRTRLHQPDLAGTDKAAAARAQHQVHRQNVGAAEQFVLLDPLDTLLCGLLRGQVLAPGDRLHAEGEADPRDRAAEPPEAQKAEGLPSDAMADAGLPPTLPHKLV